VAYGIFRKLSEHETVWVGSARERGEAEERLESLVQTFKKEFYALDLDTGEIIDRSLIGKTGSHPSESD
jgi:hypothetical protein